MKNCVTTITISLFIGVMIGICVSPSLWKGIGKDFAQSQKTKEQIIVVAMTAMQGKKVYLASENNLASAAANSLVMLGGNYATKEKADYIVSTATEKRIGFTDIDFRDHDGRLLHQVSVTKKGNAEHEAVMFAFSLVPLDLH
ncbi:hypothetical protein A2V71_03460 [Candidatus Berkelbacteria bacterium RBG_13_40_8]|uniref:Uncharacterized protein n=1 Tax=Candidatus Berkelbacteria bacterium RBG_13_40_8 TaxID=1797467 RepID=A0A1F5DQK1_9BACT|nr:MAG: hypothetical protein A2V71_03460 [Candidatus Berkelbacteria bacterium RBG_13_40_8]